MFSLDEVTFKLSMGKGKKGDGVTEGFAGIEPFGNR